MSYLIGLFVQCRVAQLLFIKDDCHLIRCSGYLSLEQSRHRCFCRPGDGGLVLGITDRATRRAVTSSEPQGDEMHRSGSKRGMIAVGLFALLAAAGCATSGDLGSVRQDAQEARRIAEEANAKASAAAEDAAAARAAAEAAAAEAREANQKADRIFQRSLHK